MLTAIGRFHPLVLHLPIGLIAGVACLEVWITLRPRSEIRQATGALLILAALAAAVAAVCGLLLARAGGYEDALLSRHRLFGLSTAALAALALLCHRRLQRSGSGLVLYRAVLAGCVIATVGAGHYGGTITHGSNTPVAMLAALVRGNADPAAESAIGGDDGLAHAALPILEARCFECHGAEKQKSGLRLDQREAALAGGESGKPAIVPSNAVASRLVEAITLPVGQKRAMPPVGKQRLAPREVLLLIDWINRGALWPDKAQARPAGVAPPAAATLDDLRDAGFRVSQLAHGHPLVRIDLVPKEASLSALAPIAEQIAWLNLAEYELDAGELRALADMPHLARLELQRSNVSDADLADVARIPHLTVLNLYGTKIGDRGLAHLRELRSLERVYLWQTQATNAGVQELRLALPTALIDAGDQGAADAPKV